MSRIFLVLIVLFLVGPAGLIAAVSNNCLGKSTSTPPQQIDVQQVSIGLSFDWKAKRALGEVTYHIQALSPIEQIRFETGFLSVKAVQLSNGTLLKFVNDTASDQTDLLVELDRTYETKATILLTIKYQTTLHNNSDPNNLGGSVGKGLRFFEPTFTEPSKRRQIWSVSEPDCNKYWFPSIENPSDLRRTEFVATVDSSLTVISNGRLVSKTKASHQQTIFRYQMDVPIANHHVSFVVGEYRPFTQPGKGLLLEHYGYPDEYDGVHASVERLPDMVDFFTKTTGLSYPFASYRQIFVQDFPNFMTGAGLSTITENMIDDDRTHGDFYYLWDLTEAEALAAQWFGANAPCRTWSDSWLNRSFAHYLSGRYNAHKNGKQEYLLYQHTWDQTNTYLADWQQGNRRPIILPADSNSIGYVSDNYVTIRGSMVLHLLQNELGEQKMRKIIRVFCKATKNGTAYTDQLTQIVDSVAQKPMRWFFDQWLFKMGHPIFEVSKTYDRQRKELKLQVKQVQQLDSSARYPQVSFFRGKVKLEIDGQIYKIDLAAERLQVFTFLRKEEPKYVNFDYESSWIKELIFNKTTTELCQQLKYSSDILAKNAAVNELAAIAQKADTNPSTRKMIEKALVELIESKSYWRLRTNALVALRNLRVQQANNSPLQLEPQMLAMLKRTITVETAWLKAAAVNFLGRTEDSSFAQLYLQALADPSDRVINAAAIALGKCQSHLAFAALVQLKTKPSWKNQSLISALNGLAALKDPRGVAIGYNALEDKTSAHWTLATPIWDYRIAAAETLVALNAGGAAFELIANRLQEALKEGDINDIFSNVLLLSKFRDDRMEPIFKSLRVHFANDLNALAAIENYEAMNRKK